MKALPPNVLAKNKYYIGFWRNNALVAIMDLILSYPNKDTAFIGLFMMNKKFQRMSIGTVIINELVKELRKESYKHIKLLYIEGNKESRGFWIKNKFVESGNTHILDKFTLVEMRRDLV